MVPVLEGVAAMAEGTGTYLLPKLLAMVDGQKRGVGSNQLHRQLSPKV